MGEEARETTSSAGARCMSPSQVKQTLSKLDKDGETRRNAMNSLKQWVEAMDAASVPRFLVQVSETKEKGNSRAYAISLYEDVARVHGKLVIPHIPRVMSTVTRTLSSSGSSPQLQQACAKVLSSVVKHAIDESSPAQASDVLRDLCDPLLEVLAGKLEPLAAGAAVCLQTLVESEKWKYASDAVIGDLCLKTTVALAEKGTRTVAHMQLARSLAVTNSAFLSNYGVALLRAGVEVLKCPAASASWQQRASAARLLTAVLPAVDRATLAEELSSTVQALDNCKHDGMSTVRSAVREALKTAKWVLSAENSRRAGDGEEPLSLATGFLASSSSSPGRRSEGGGASSDDLMSPRRRSLGGGVSSDDMMMSPLGPNSNKGGPRALHRGASVPSSTSPFSPSGSSRSRAAARAASPRAEVMLHRSPLRATTRLHDQVVSQGASSVTSLRDFESLRKENLPSYEPDTKTGTLAFDSEPVLNRTPTCVRPRAAATDESAFSPRSSSPAAAALQHSMDMETIPIVMWKGGEEDHLFPPEQEGDFLAEDEEMFLFSNGDSPRIGSRHEEGQFVMKTSGDGSKDSTANCGASRSHHGVLDGSTMKHVFELKGPVAGSVVRESARTRDIDETVRTSVSPSKSIGDWNEPPNGLLDSPFKADSLADLTTFEDSCSPQQLKPLFVAEDLVSFTTPRRLVRSLQESFLSPKSEYPAARVMDHDISKLRGDDVIPDTMITDMDMGTPTSSGTSWSVRTNPIASDESLRTESDDSDHEQGRAVWKKMVLESSTSPTPPAPHTPPPQETDTPDINDGFRHRLNHPASATVATVMQQDEISQPSYELITSEDLSCGESTVQVKPELEEEVEIIKRTEEVACSPIMSMSGDLFDLTCGFAHDDFVETSCGEIRSSTSGQEIRVASADGVATESAEGSDIATATAAADVVEIGNENSMQNLGETLTYFFGRGWSQRWQVCAVVIAIPLAIALSQVVFPSDLQYTEYLVPT